MIYRYKYTYLYLYELSQLGGWVKKNMMSFKKASLHNIKC